MPSSPESTASPRVNAFGQPIGAPVPAWKPVAHPPHVRLDGRHSSVHPLDPEAHAAGLWKSMESDDGRAWTYLSIDKPASLEAYRAWLEQFVGSKDPQFYVIHDAEGKPVGVSAYLRVDPNNGTIEVGHINYSPLLQRTRTATEAMYLLMRNAFELGYRRYEWKCDSLNTPSRKAAERLGFIYEGMFRQAVVYKGRNRDTCWFSITDAEWKNGVKQAFEEWLDDRNFGADGRQIKSLEEIRREIVGKQD